MGITVLTDIFLPDSVMRAGVTGRNVRNNLRTMTYNGYAAVNINWTKTLRQYEIGVAPMHLDIWQTIEGLHEATEGGAYGFLMFDPKDSSVLSTEGELYPYEGGALIGTSGVGYGTPVYKMFKKYTSVGGTRVKRRQITRPVAAGTVFKRGGSTVTPTVNYDTGTVTFAADASQTIASHTVGTKHVLTFANASGILAVLAAGQRVYLTNVSGTAASTLNNKSHLIDSVDLINFKMTLTTNTAGLNATGGTAYKYPQASEALTWSGSFYVPVHFLDDSIEWEILRPGTSTQRIISGVNIVLQEIRE